MNDIPPEQHPSGPAIEIKPRVLLLSRSGKAWLRLTKRHSCCHAAIWIIKAESARDPDRGNSLSPASLSGDDYWEAQRARHIAQYARDSDEAMASFLEVNSHDGCWRTTSQPPEPEPAVPWYRRKRGRL